VILAIRSDGHRAELYLLDSAGNQLQAKQWNAGYELSKHILREIVTLLSKEKKQVKDISGVIVYQGPGSFTALRIGISVANALAYANQVPVVGRGQTDWLSSGLQALAKQKVGVFVIPEYGRDPHITKPRK
jgi:tRNA threonylcarbamoyladenosine biosynthesis protein TsaB